MFSSKPNRLKSVFKSISASIGTPIAAPIAGVAILAIALTGCGSGSSGSKSNPVIQDVQGPTVSYVNGSFILSAVIENVTLQGGATVPIPHMPNSTIEVGPDLQTDGLLLSVSLNAADIASLTGADLLDPEALPDGRALPGVAQGTLPAIAVEVPQWDNMVFYVGPTIFGAFVPVSFGLQGYEATFDFYDTSGTNIGQISIIGEDTSGKDSGFLLLIPISGTVGSIVNSAQLK